LIKSPSPCASAFAKATADKALRGGGIKDWISRRFTHRYNLKPETWNLQPDTPNLELGTFLGSVYEQAVILTVVLAIPALMSILLLLWQWLVARQFPLHDRSPNPHSLPAVTILKPLKGSDATTEKCLRSWFTQNYRAPIQILFGVASAHDPVCTIVEKLSAEFPAADAQLVICNQLIGTNSKAAKLAELQKSAKHDVLIVSDADILAPADLMSNAVTLLERDHEVGVVNCFYQLANPSTLAMEWEAIATNADFWSQVLQSRSLKPLDFALGAVMLLRRQHLERIGGFGAFADCLADDYQLGNRLVKLGLRIELCPIVVECWDPPSNWGEAWRHQLRWARTIRVCQPTGYFFSILSNPTLWPLLWAVLAPAPLSIGFLALSLILRIVAALDLQAQLTRSHRHFRFGWLVPIKDLLNAAIWIGSFAGNNIEWRGERYHLRRDGTLVKV
jgi:ceramide glucosyltransferase